MRRRARGWLPRRREYVGGAVMFAVSRLNGVKLAVAEEVGKVQMQVSLPVRVQVRNWIQVQLRAELTR